MNDILHFVESPYSLRSKYTLERNRNYTAYHGSESLFSWLRNNGIFYQITQNNPVSLKESKTKINSWTGSTTVLAKYQKYMLGEQDLFKLFHRFCIFSFCILLFDLLHIIILRRTSFSGIFFEISKLVFHLTILGFLVLYFHVWMFRQILEILGSFMETFVLFLFYFVLL